MATPLNQRLVHAATQTRKMAINQYVRGLAAGNDKTKLDCIANILKVSANLNIFTERNNIILEIHRCVTDQPSMDALSTLLKLITNKDFCA